MHGTGDSAFKADYATDLTGCVTGIGVLFNRDSRGNYHMPDETPVIKLEISSFPLTAKGALAKAGAGVINTKTFCYSDSARSGVAKDDADRIYLPLKDAAALCGMGLWTIFCLTCCVLSSRLNGLYWTGSTLRAS